MGRMWARDYVSAQLAVYEAHRRVSHRTYRLAVLATWPLPRSLSLSSASPPPPPTSSGRRRREAPRDPGDAAAHGAQVRGRPLRQRRARRKIPPLLPPCLLHRESETPTGSGPWSASFCSQIAELFTLTYGAIVRQLLTDLEEVEEVNKQLDQMYVWFFSSSVSNFLVQF
mgnify:CR=1 FL=1